MKKYAILIQLLILFTIGSSEAQTVNAEGYFNNYPRRFDFQKPFIVVVNKLNIRKEPSVHSPIIDSLTIGETIDIKKVTKNELKTKGISLPFVKVSYFKNKVNFTGYAWLGYLSESFVEINNHQFFSFINSVTDKPLDGNSSFILKAALLDSKKKLTVLFTELGTVDGELYTNFESRKTNFMFDEVSFNFSYEACCSSYCRLTYLFTKEGIKEMPKLSWNDACGDGVYRNYDYSKIAGDSINYSILEGTYSSENKKNTFKWNKVLEGKTIGKIICKF